MGLRASAEDESGEWAEEESDCCDCERQAEEAEGLRVEVEEVAHAEGVVAGVLGEELGEVGVGCGGAGMQEEVDAGGGEDRAGDQGEDDGVVVAAALESGYGAGGMCVLDFER